MDLEGASTADLGRSFVTGSRFLTLNRHVDLEPQYKSARDTSFKSALAPTPLGEMMQQRSNSAAFFKPFLSRAAVGLLAAGAPVAALAQAPAAELSPAFIERMDKESKARDACKKSICQTVRSKKAEGDALACKVVKTWPSQELSEKVFKGKMEWKWGHAQCEADIKLDSATLAKVAAEPKLDLKVGKHKVACNLGEGGRQGEPQADVLDRSDRHFRKRQGDEGRARLERRRRRDHRQDRAVVGHRRRQHVQRPARLRDRADQRFPRPELPTTC